MPGAVAGSGDGRPCLPLHNDQARRAIISADACASPAFGLPTVGVRIDMMEF